MASLRVLAFDHEGRPIQFDTWLDDLQVYLLSDSRDSVSLFDLAPGTAPAPFATDDSATRSQWLTRDAAARVAIRNHLPLAEYAHFGQHRTAQALYDVVVARYSSPATAALGRLLLPYLFPELSAFATVEDLVSHLRTSDARYRVAAPAEFLDKNQPPMFITLYSIVTRLFDSLRSVKDHFLSLDPTTLTINLLEQHLLATETSVVAVGAARGTPCTPFFEGFSPSPLAPSYASTATIGPLNAVVGVAVVAVVGVEAVGLELGVEVQEEARGSSSSFRVRPRRPSSFTCARPHAQRRYFSRLDDAWRTEFGDEAERPRWADLFRAKVAIFDLDFDVILASIYALSTSGEGDFYRCVPPDPRIEAPALGATESVLPGTAPAEALHTFTLDSVASCCFFRDSATLTPLSAPVPVRLADPSGGPVVAHSSTVLPCPAVPSGSLSGLHLPSFSTNLVSTAALQDAMVTTTTPGGQRVSICTCNRTRRHLATFTRRPGSSLYTLASEPPQVVASAQVSALGQVAPPCLCRLLSHQTLLCHHRLGHPSLPRLRGMHSRLLVSSLPRSLPPLPPSPALPYLPFVEGRQRAAPHSSSFSPTTAPLQTIHMDVWAARITEQGRERYFLLVVDDYTRYTTVFPLRSKGEVPDGLIPSIRAVRLQLRERFRQDLPVLRLHSDRGGEFSSDLFWGFCRGEGILDSPQQNGIAECRIGLVMEVARTSVVHLAAPHFLWPFAVRYATHQLNLWPRVSLPETSPTLHWTRKVGDASVFRVWGSRAFLRDTSTDKLSARAIPCVFLGFVPDAPGWQLYHPTSRRVLPSQDLTFDESVPFYHLVPYRSAPLTPPLLFLAPGPPLEDPLPPQGRAPSGVSQVDPTPGTVPGETGGAERWGVEPGGIEPGGAEPEGAESGGAESEGAEPEGAEPGGAGPRGTASSGGFVCVSPRLSPRPESLSPQQLREWFARRTRLWSGAAGAGGSAAGGAKGTGVFAGAGIPRGAGPTSLGGARTRGAGAAGAGCAGGAGAGSTSAGAPGAGTGAAGGTGAARVGGTTGVGVGGAGPGGAGADSGDTRQPRPYFVPLLQQVLGLLSSIGLPPPFMCPPPNQLQLLLQSPSPLPAPSHYTEQTGGLTERCELESSPASPVHTGRRVPTPRLPPVPGTHAMALRPSSVPLRVPLPAPLESSLPAVPDPESDCARAASPNVSRLLATVVTDPSFEPAAASALVTELVDFAAACRLDYATALVAESGSASPLSVGGECALGTDILEDRQEDFECLAAAVPRFASMLLAPEGDPDAPDNVHTT
ncbi:unnamed protein product [Closterium sp. NIES-54]